MSKREMLIFIGILEVLLFCVVITEAQPYHTKQVQNSKLMRIDTLFVTGTDTAYTPVFWQAAHNEKSVVVSLNDTSSAGFSADSGNVKIIVKQAFDYGNLSKKVRLFTSLSTQFTSGVLYDSLDITDMDTLETWLRDTLPTLRYNRDTTGYYATDTLATLTTSDAAAYIQVVPDYSPGLVLQIIGLSKNKKGSANKVLIYWYQQQGLPVNEDQ